MPSKTWEDFFPYNIRPAQLDIIEFITAQLKQRKHVVVEAANGTGKTIATLSAVLPYAQKYGKKIVYMARTHSQMDRVMEELMEIHKNSDVSGVIMRSRGSMCVNRLLLDHASDNRTANEICSYLKKSKRCEFYNNMLLDSRLLPALSALKIQPATSELVFELAEQQKICPSELVRKAIPSVDVIACSYVYIFDPDIRETFLGLLEVEMNDLILVVDEAHNLPDTAINIDSDTISSFSFTRALREASSVNRRDIAPFFEAGLEVLSSYAKGMKVGGEKMINGAEFFEDVELKMEDLRFDFSDYNDELAEDFFEELIEIGNIIRERMIKQNKDPVSSIGRLGEFFLFLYRAIGLPSFVTTVEKKSFRDGKRNEYDVLRTTSLDARTVTVEPLADSHLSIHISGTIGDPKAYLQLTGLNELDVATKLLPSPYSKDNIAVYVTNKLSSLYAHRTSKLFEDIVSCIVTVVRHTPGNIGVFAPSYSFLKQLMEHGLEARCPKPLYEAKQNMGSKDNDVLISRFKREASRGGAVLCAVIGGRSSEGTDFKGDLMNAVCVVGIPFAPPSPRSKAHIDYLEKSFPGEGRSLGYVMPAINRASQAAGRAVRSLKDRAFILLIDFRYNQYSNRRFLPAWMTDSMKRIEPKEELIAERVHQFFR